MHSDCGVKIREIGEIKELEIVKHIRSTEFWEFSHKKKEKKAKAGSESLEQDELRIDSDSKIRRFQLNGATGN